MRLLLRFLLALLIVLPAATPPAQADDANTIHVVAVAIDLYAGAYYAQDQGFFKAAGLDVDITTLANGGAAATALAGGSTDIASTNLVQVATAIAHGVPLTVIAGGGLYSTNAPSTAVCVLKTSPLHTARDLEGKTVGVAALNDQATLALKKWLGQNGADYKKVRMIELGYPEMIAGLTAGRIDAAILAEPWQTTARNGDDRLYANRSIRSRPDLTSVYGRRRRAGCRRIPIWRAVLRARSTPPQSGPTHIMTRRRKYSRSMRRRIRK